MADHRAPVEDRIDSAGTICSAAELLRAVGGAGWSCSSRRRVAAILPLLAGLIGWLVVPGSAADFRLDTAGDRYGTISHGLGRGGDYPIHIPGYNHENAGTLLMHEVGGGDVEAYCIDLRGVRNPAAVYRSGERRIDQIAYILNHHFPVARGAGDLADLDAEAAAVQLAVWTYSDAVNLDTVTAPSVPRFGTVLARARQIAGEAAAAWSAWAARQSAQPAVSLQAPAGAVAPGSVTLTATVSGASEGAPVTFTVTAGAGTVDGQRSLTRGLSGGQATVQVGASAPGVVTVVARVTGSGLAYLQLNPSIRPNQTLILASQLPVSGESTQSIGFIGVPRLTLAKSVADGASSGTSIQARPGDRLRYTLSYANQGNAVASAATISDELTYRGLSQLSAASVVLQGGASNSFDAGSRRASWALGDLPPGASGTVGLEVALPPSLADDGRGLDVCNRGSLSASGTAPIASNAACAQVVTRPHLVTVKVVDASSAEPGQLLRYTITVRNDGDRDLTDLVAHDRLSGGNLDLLTEVEPGAGGGYDAATRTATWSIPSLPSGQSIAVGLTARIPSARLPQGTDTCFLNTAVAGGGNSGGSYPSPPVSSCVHPAPPAAATPGPGLPATGSGPPLALTAPPEAPPGDRAALSGVPGDAEATRGGWLSPRLGIAGASLASSAVILLGGRRRSSRLR